MFTNTWSKYTPVIRILLKRSVNGDQVLDLERAEFERAGIGKKTTYKFSIEFSNGRLQNFAGSSGLAKDLAAVMLQDDVIKKLTSENDYTISLNTKFQIVIKYKGTKEKGTEDAIANDTPEESLS